MRRDLDPGGRHAPGAALIAAGLLLAACGMPQAPEPEAASEPTAEAPAELLGATAVEVAAAEPVPAPVELAAAPPLREGWGSMAPIANPPEDAPAGRRAPREARDLPLDPAPAYALVGPRAPEPQARLARAAPKVVRARVARNSPRVVRARVAQASPPPSSYVVVEHAPRIVAAPTTAAGRLKVRIRHWIMPARKPV